jgi:hypothetical protein
MRDKVKLKPIKICTKCGYFYYLDVFECIDCKGKQFKHYTLEQFEEIEYRNHLEAKSL